VVGEVCIDSGWGEKTTFVIVAAQSVKNNVTDRSGSAVTNMLVDSGYTGQPFADAVQNVLGVTVEVARRNELHTFAMTSKRWVVERSFAWLETCRRLWKICKQKLNTSLQFVSLAFLALLLHRSQTGSNRL